MTPEELKGFEERQAEMQQTRDLFDLICSRLNLKYGEFFGFRDTRGFAVLNIYNDQGNKTRALKVSQTAEVLIDTHKYHSVYQSNTKRNILFFSELRDRPDGYNTTRKGVLDENFEVLLPAQYDSLRDINEDSFLATIDDYAGILNSRFEIIIPLKFREIEYNETLKIFKAREQIIKEEEEEEEEESSIYRIFDQNGMLVNTLEYGLVNFANSPSFYTVYDIGSFSSDYVDPTVMIGRQGLLDQNFKTIIPPLYDLIFKGEKFILAYEERNAEVGRDYGAKEAEGSECYYTLDGGKWGAFDHGGSLIIPFEYSWIGQTLKDDLFLINPSGLMYYYQGEQEDGAWYVKDGLWGLINSKNEIMVEPIYRHYQLYDSKIIFFNRQSADYRILDTEDALTIHL